MGQPGKDAADVLDGFIRGLGLPRSLQDVHVGPEHFDRIAEQAMATRGSSATRARSNARRRSARSCCWPHKETGETMYTGKHARLRPLQPAFIMASTGEAVTYAELEARSNRLAHLFRKYGLKRLDHYAIFMENNSRYLECCSAGERAGLYFTCVNSYLTPGELAYIVNNSSHAS